MALSKLNYNSLNLTPVAGKGIGFDSGADDLEASFSGGAMTFISKSTASSSSNISFTSGIDSTYKEYLFIFTGIHPATDGASFQFQGNAAGGADFNETVTSTAFHAYHAEDASEAVLTYETSNDLAQGTGFITMLDSCGSDNDQNSSGTLHLFNPSSTTFVKHFISRVNGINNSDKSNDFYNAGYFNTTSAIDEIQFKMSSGDIDAGTITLYGIN